MLMIGRLLVGLLLLVLGRRLYWLFVAGIGFLTGLELAPRLLPQSSEAVIVMVALVLAIVGALVAVLATKIAVGIIGFAAAGAIAVLLLRGLGVVDDVITLAVYLVAGVVGALLMLVIFDWTLVVLSSLAGAGLIVTSLEPLVHVPPAAGPVLVIALAVIGVLVQMRLLHAGDSRARVR